MMLKKFRLGRSQPQKDFNDHSVGDSRKVSVFEFSKSAAGGIRASCSSDQSVQQTRDRMQMEVRRRLNEELEVQKHLQMRIDAQGKYMQTILEKAAAQTIENLESPMVIWSDDLQPEDIVIETPDFHSDGDSFKDDPL
ncbi:hypothetical protein REPUB_Repub12eG0051300 [Reevesia pubescens]